MRRYLVLVSFFAVLVQVQGQDLAASLLWKVEGDDIQTSYLFGTIHMLPKSDYTMKEKVKSALSSCDNLVLEMDITAAGMEFQIMQHASMTDGHTLNDFLPDSTLHALDSVMVKSTGMGLAMFTRMKPFIVSSFLTGSLVGDEPVSFELELAKIAQKDSLQILGLETVLEQLAVFDSIPYALQADDLAEMVWNGDAMSLMYDELILSYNAEDLNSLARLLAEEIEDPTMQDQLLSQRNMRWVPKIESFAKQESCFIAVGAAHLAGEMGLIQLLKEKGYRLSPVIN